MRLQLRFPYQVRLRATLCGVESTEITSFAENEKGRGSNPRPGTLVSVRAPGEVEVCFRLLGEGGRSSPIQATFSRLC
jgi:hypothetical protein